MTAFRILNLLALSALATLFTALGPQPVVALSNLGSKAVSFGRNHPHARVAQHMKRSSSKKCKARPSSSEVATSTHHDATPKATSTVQAKPTQTHSSGSSTPPPSGSGGTKLGLAWADGAAGYLSNLAGAKYIYTWNAECPTNSLNLGLICLPQLWGWRNVDDFTRVAKDANPPFFLTFNEPQEPGQSNMDVGSGITLWKQAIKPLTDNGQKACSPATSSNPNGLTWVEDFVKECPECEFDYVCVHWYDTTFDKFQAYVELWHNTFGKDIFITEFGLQNFNGGAQPTLDEVFAFMNQAIPWMNSQPWILGYFPFGFMVPPTGINVNMNLLNGDGSPTSLGQLVLDKSGAK